MSGRLAFLAEGDALKDLAKHARYVVSGIPQSLIFLGVILGIALLAFGWVALFRKRRRRHKHRHHHRERNGEMTAGQSSQPAVPLPMGTSRKRRRRGHRPRNPTLAETRGLPPARSETPTPPPY